MISRAKVSFIVGGEQDLRYVVEGLGGRSSGGRNLKDIMLILFIWLDKTDRAEWLGT